MLLLPFNVNELNMRCCTFYFGPISKWLHMMMIMIMIGVYITKQLRS